MRTFSFYACQTILQALPLPTRSLKVSYSLPKSIQSPLFLTLPTAFTCKMVTQKVSMKSQGQKRWLSSLALFQRLQALAVSDFPGRSFQTGCAIKMADL